MKYLFSEKMEANVPRYADMLELLRRGAPVAYDSAQAMLIVEDNGVCTLGAEDMEEGKRALTHLPKVVREVVVREMALRDYAIETLGFAGSSECVQVVYTADAPRPQGSKLVIRHPSPADWDAVRGAYHLIDEETLYEHFNSDDFFCGYYEGHLASFAGLHTEGAMGMLYVFPQYRRMGLGEEMGNYMVNRQRALGRYAYAHIFCDNEASIALQRKAKMTFGDRHIFWVWKDGDD